ncbi:hypothetical protein ACFLZL_01205 [Thermodesulfobacteriota bacterium]
MQVKHERTLQLVVVIVAAVLALYFGYRLFDKWHRATLDTAVQNERRQWNRQAEKFIKEIDQLQQQVEAQDEPVMPKGGAKSVIDEKTADLPPMQKQHDCDRLKRQIIAFFEYLDEQNYVLAYRFEEKTLPLFQNMLVTASQNLPVNIAETRDILTLLHNIAHFYRAFGKKRCLLIKDILRHESDFIEPVLATFFAYLFRHNGCKDPIVTNPSPEVLYNYAGFFLNTIGGRSYLFRRNPLLRILLNYYCVIILDRANNDKLNHYGIDIRPYINRSIFEIRNHKGLQNRREYLSRLNRLQSKY